jgi:O-antigen/teichoic acid export membrane protein
VRYGKGKPERNLTKELLLYSWPLFLNSIFWLSLSGIDSLILGLFTSPEDVAYYGVAAKIAPLIAVPLGAVNAVVPPLIAQYNQAGEFKSLEQVAQTTARWMYLLSLPLTIIIILLAPNLLRLFGANFLKAQFALTVLSLGQIVNVSAGSVGLILALTGSQWFLIKGQLLVGTVTIPLMIFLGKSFGISGVALASAFGLAGINVFMAWAVWRRLGIKGFVLKTRWANLGAGVGLIIFFLTKPYAGQIGGTICFALGYLAIVGKKLKEEFAGILQASHGIGATL